MDHRQKTKVWLPVIGGLLAAVALSGCAASASPTDPPTAPSGGQSQSDLDATLAQIPGLTVTASSGAKPNIKGNSGYSYDLALDPQYRIADPEALVTFLVEAAWSVRDGAEPNTAIDVYLAGVPADGVDLSLAAEGAGWVPPGSQTRGAADNGFTSARIWLDTEGSKAEARGAIANRERLGDWPGTVPALPADLTVPREQ